MCIQPTRYILLFLCRCRYAFVVDIRRVSTGEYNIVISTARVGGPKIMHIIHIIFYYLHIIYVVVYNSA